MHARYLQTVWLTLQCLCYSVATFVLLVIVGTCASLTATSPASPAAFEFLYATITRGTLQEYYLRMDYSMVIGPNIGIKELDGHIITQLTAVASTAHLFTQKMGAMPDIEGSQGMNFINMALESGVFDCLSYCLHQAILVRHRNCWHHMQTCIQLHKMQSIAAVQHVPQSDFLCEVANKHRSEQYYAYFAVGLAAAHGLMPFERIMT